jgi:23S rRNA (cytidine1920-2'-O)/16S rRNA (cytidine1409-2'-O)-methyltransferase
VRLLKKRLDVYLAEHGMALSLQQAQRIIMSGCVYVDNQKADKAGIMVMADSVVEMRGHKQKYVSRGGYKLEKAISFFNIELQNCICMDVGASTGGFTDCMLQNDAAKVYSVDVGYGLLFMRTVSIKYLNSATE